MPLIIVSQLVGRDPNLGLRRWFYWIRALWAVFFEVNLKIVVKIFCINFAEHTIQFTNFNNLFTRLDRG